LVTVIYDERFLKHYSEGYAHPESPSRLITALNALKESGLMGKITTTNAGEPNYNLPYEVHDRDYVEFIKSLSSSGFNYVDGDTYVNEYTYEVAVLALTASVKSYDIREVSGEPVFVLARPPGHHAGIRGRALGAPTLGFCIFNNIALLARYLVRRGLRRVVIVDIDAHHGNGTQEIFWSDPHVIHIDIHQYGIYPGTGDVYDVGSGEAEGTKINIPLPRGSGDDAYNAVLNDVVDPVINDAKPDYILISAGYDAHYSDPLTGLRASAATYYKYFKHLLELSEKLCSKRLIAILEGGYAEGLSKGLPNSIAALLGEGPCVTEVETSGTPKQFTEVLSKVKEVVGRYWKLS